MANIDDDGPQGNIPVDEWEALRRDSDRVRAQRANVTLISEGKRPNGAAAPKPAKPEETALALSFVEKHRDRYRHVSMWNKWLQWTGERWEIEETRMVAHEARLVSKDNNGGGRFRTIQAIERIASSEPGIAATTKQWDANLQLINTATISIDCKTGTFKEHDPNDYCTKLTGASPSTAGCPKFLEFMREIFSDHEELIRYMQKVFGYCLTGVTAEQQLWFFYGTGANGKSVLLNTISGILGDYAMTAPIETFTATNYNAHKTELACLMGARLVVANETEEGRRWAEAKIKTLTGGEPIRANFMRQDTFEFTPQFKLIVAGNHKPSLRTVDEAIRRRLNLIPFSVTIPTERRNPNLAAELQLEWPGILQWMIDGCVLWQVEGLKPPDIVKKATEEYLASEDTTAQWIEDRCELNAHAMSTRAELFKSWKDWADLSGEYAGTNKQFVAKMLARGYEEYTLHGNRGFRGIEVH